MKEDISQELPPLAEFVSLSVGRSAPMKTVEAPSPRFAYSTAFWSEVVSDPQVAQALECELQRRIEARLAAEMAPARERLEASFREAREEARREGFETGRKEGWEAVRGDVGVLTLRMDTICGNILDEKLKLLRSHEKIWGSALRRLLSGFLVPRAGERTEQIQAWLSEHLSGFPEEAKITVRLSTADFAALPALVLDARRKWELVDDPTLSAGEVRCECKEGGVFFSRAEGYEKLDRWLEQHRMESTG